jgi:Arc/MetJ-type ribon-helix-helix transcriptional regulator
MTMTVKLERALEQTLRTRCAELGKTASDFMREALEKYLELTKPKTASAYELGKDLFGKYASADDSGSTNRRAHRAAGLDAKYDRLQKKAIR